MTKTRLTISVDEEILAALQQLVSQRRWSSRSAAVAHVLAEWLEGERVRSLERETEAYYRSLSDAERQEDAEWARMAAESASRTWQAGH